VFVQIGKNQRWGDYTGLQRKYNEQGVVWGSGYFGKYDSAGVLKRVNGTWISQLVSPTFNSIKKEEKKAVSSLIAYPNPVNNDFRVEFDCKKTAVFEFKLIDESGRQVKLLLRNLVHAGTNTFTFSTDPLSAGVYYLVIESSEEKLTKKIMISSPTE
jgi:hypothetical protein